MTSKSRKSGVSRVIEKNVQALAKVRKAEQKSRTFHQCLGDTIGSFVGSFGFIYINLGAILAWLICNTGIFGHKFQWDSYPFPILAISISIESIFLTGIVLVNQRRMTILSERTADLDLQMSLLAEHEITRLVEMVEVLSRKLGISAIQPGELKDIKTSVSPENVLRHIEQVENKMLNKE
jgi:uncharacterized membrane protein